jgi:hypothetical protein
MTEIHQPAHARRPLPFPLYVALFLTLITVFVSCRSRSPSFSPVAMHPELSAQEMEIVSLRVIARLPGERRWRFRAIGYNDTGLVAASILGPWFDAEENPAGMRPLYLADGYFRNDTSRQISLPARGASIYLRLFEHRWEPEGYLSEGRYIDDEFLALHIRLGFGPDAGTAGQGSETSGPRERNGEEPACQASFWKIHNPVRSIYHCNFAGPGRSGGIEIEILEGEDGVPYARLRGHDLLSR